MNKAKLSYRKLLKIRKELSKLAVPIGTVHISPVPSADEIAQWNRLPRWLNNRLSREALRFDLKGNIVNTPCCPRCDRPMTRQPRGGLRCGRHDCTVRPGLSTAKLP